MMFAFKEKKHLSFCLNAFGAAVHIDIYARSMFR